MSTSIENQLSLAPLGAGDLIDRAVRLYRRHLFILIRVAAPPVIVAAGGWILLSLSFRRLMLSPEIADVVLYLILGALGCVIVLAGYLFTLVVMGGATRNLVAHLLRNDPVTARTTYNEVRTRFWGLLGAAVVVLIWISFSSFAAAFVLYLAAILIGAALLLVGLASPWLSAIVGVIGFLAAMVASVWVFFFIVGRVAYVPQAMLVEGRGVFEAVSRSFSLARGNVRRLMGMTLFTTFATNSALMILLIPLGWYGYVSGVDLWDSAQWPAWYAISYSVVGTLSSILLAPVWMLGLSLLYVDERVRHEGYDIELMAARQLGELPDINVASPFGPALSASERKPPPPSPPMSTGRVLKLS
jgi:hypothetical protein